MRDCRSPSSAVREHLTLMGPNFPSRLPKSGRSRRWTFESAPEGSKLLGAAPNSSSEGLCLRPPWGPPAGLLPTLTSGR